MPSAVTPSSLTTSLENYTTEEEATKLQQILEEEGADAAIAALREFDRGWPGSRAPFLGALTFEFTRGRTGARSSSLLINRSTVLARCPTPTCPGETPSGFIQLQMNNQGQGRGRMAEATGMRVTDSGVFQVEASRATPVEIEEARRVK